MRPHRTLALLALLLPLPLAGAVFQYRLAIPAKKGESQAFCWIPPESERIRGVVIGGMTLMEREFVKDPVIRRACAEHDLALVFARSGLGRLDVPALLAEFASVSGYAELAHAPLCFVGHSAGGPQAKRKAIEHAGRCFGLVQYRGGAPGGEEPLPPHVPALMMIGQFDEFAGRMRTEDGTARSLLGAEASVHGFRSVDAANLCAAVVEPGAGHFAWSDRNADYLALWLAKAADARIPDADAESPPALIAVDPAVGWLTDARLAADRPHPPAAHDDYAGDRARASWHFDREMAEATVAYHRGLDGKDQFIRWEDGHWVDAGARFFFTGIDWVDDGASFRVHPVYAEQVPGQHKGRGPIWPQAGEPVGHADVPIRVKVVGGPIVRVDEHTFRLRFDALAPIDGRKARATFLASGEGDDEFRYTEQVGMMPRGFRGLGRGPEQTITFPAIDDVHADAGPIALGAKSDSGLPVEYYVGVGPARIEDGELRISEVPERARFPIAVEVVAWQPGSGIEPKFKTAGPVVRTCRILAP